MAIVNGPKKVSVNQKIAEVFDMIQSGDGSPDSQDRINRAILEALQAIERKLPIGMI